MKKITIKDGDVIVGEFNIYPDTDYTIDLNTTMVYDISMTTSESNNKDTPRIDQFWYRKSNEIVGSARRVEFVDEDEHYLRGYDLDDDRKFKCFTKSRIEY